MTLSERRHIELKAKLADLDADIGAWKARTADEPMRRHYSQVGRLSRTLDGLLESMTTSSGWKTPAPELVLEKAAEWERRILTAHAIWEVFRGKLAQRLDPRFQMRLAACDDLAWACYEPAMTKFSTGKKEPPLLYLNSTWSAFLRKRNTTFEKEVTAGKDAREMLDEDDYRETLKQLPVPLLGLPWFQVGHLPSALMIAHEIGHAVEFDFELTSRIDKALTDAALAFEDDWKMCVSEVFADLYGHLCLGRHFANCLLDLLVTNKDFVRGEDTFGLYPTRAFRVELSIEALTFLNFEAEAAAVRDAWETTYGSVSQLKERLPDVKKVVAAIYGEKGLGLASLIQPPAYGAASDPVPALAQDAVNERAASLAQQSDARVLFCALREAYDTYSTTKSDRAAAVLIKHIAEKNGQAFRFRGAAVDTREKAQISVDDIAAQDVAAGKALAKTLGLETH